MSDCMSGTRGSGVLFSTGDVFVRGVGGVSGMSNLVAVTDWGGANSRLLGLVSVWAARSFDQTTLRPSVIKRIRQIDVKYITHITSFCVTCVNTHV